MRIYGHIALVSPEQVGAIGTPVTSLCGRAKRIKAEPPVIFCPRCVREAIARSAGQRESTDWLWVSMTLKPVRR